MNNHTIKAPIINPEFIVEESKENFSTWINRPYVPHGLREQLSTANVLIIPREGFREHPEPIFPVGTEELFQYLKDASDKGIIVDICIADNDYRELALHDALVIIGGFIVTSLIAPVFVSLISEYIKKRFGFKEKRTKIKIEITAVEKDGRATRLLFEGSAKDFSTTIKQALKSLPTQKTKKLPKPRSETPKEQKS
jgi:hypothetical protein